MKLVPAALAVFVLAVPGISQQKSAIKAGVARVDITPETPIWMSGYGNRNKPSEGVATRLWAKALAFEDAKGKAVIVTTDLIGLPRAVSDLVAARCQKQYGLERSRILFNSSHTHTGPVVGDNLTMMWDLSEEDRRRIRAYATRLADNLVSVVGASLGDLAPANISYGSGQAGFAINRREPTPKGVRIGLNPKGPVDHSVPVVKITAPDGRIRAVLFGYACHNTTLGGDFYKITGDYAGFAQEELERLQPGATALFMLLCGGDQNPNPRTTLDLAGKHGKTLAEEVNRVLSGATKPVNGPIRTAFQMTELNFARHERAQFEERLKDANPTRVRHAKAMLAAYDERRPIRRIPYPVQAISFGKDLAILALGGEVVVDYALRAKKEFGAEGLIVAGYSNDVMCYIPSLRVLKEGGYEAADSMVYYGQPGPFDETVEETVFKAVRQVMKRVNR